MVENIAHPICIFIVILLNDYGPAHTTWCFSFECCNGILGSMPNNNKSLDIEKTMIRCFINQMENSNNKVNDEILSFFPEEFSGSLSEPLSQLSILKLF